MVHNSKRAFCSRVQEHLLRTWYAACYSPMPSAQLSHVWYQYTVYTSYLLIV